MSVEQVLGRELVPELERLRAAVLAQEVRKWVLLAAEVALAALADQAR